MCDSLVAAPTQTASGRTLYGKNSDRKGEECQPFVQFPAAHYARGSQLRCTHIEIPQVAESYRVMGHSPWWVWGFEHGVNEHAVAIGNHAVFSNETIEERPGLIGMDLVRLGLERGRTAREALEVIAGLLEAHGQGGPALAPHGTGYHNSFVLADACEAWQLETSNRHWAARRVSLAAVSNHYSIGNDWEIASRDAGHFAVAAGWCSPETRLDVAAAYGNPHVPPQFSQGRRRAAERALSAAAGAHDVASFTAALRDHGECGAAWTTVDSTPADERHFTLCAHSEPVSSTTASLVAELPVQPSAAAWPVWVAFGTPCTALYLPLYLDGILPAQLAVGGSAPETDSAWWSFKHLQDLVSQDPAVRFPRLREVWAKQEVAIEEARVVAERAAFEAEDGDASADQLTRFMQRSVDRVLERASDLAAELARVG
ncbi:MAG: C69 family dipeptidase [Deltaproteobacteria bacterium]|nr:C69 family dipeptidase [Deltaproteobacteria bacterium]